jgi:AraC-like DNA-binding protein
MEGKKLYTKTLNELNLILHLLKEEGYEIYLNLSEEFPENIKKELSAFNYNEKYKCAYVCEVNYQDVVIANIYVSSQKQKANIASFAVKYVLERLYEESIQFKTEVNDNDIYKKALQFIKENYTKGITVAEVSKHVGYSESYFGYAFKKKYKMSVSRYVRELQLMKAKDLLADTDFTISTVANYVGFN